MKACRVARRLAVDSFQSIEVTSACVVFTTLLGQDTSLLRLYLRVASHLAEHLSNQPAVESSNQHSSSASADSAYDPAVMQKICKYVISSLTVLFKLAVSVNENN